MVSRDIVSIRELPRIIGRVIWWVDFHRAGYADDEVVRLTGWEVCNEEHLTWICGPWSLGMDKYFHPTLHQARDYLSMLGSNLSNVNKAPVTLSRPDSRLSRPWWSGEVLWGRKEVGKERGRVLEGPERSVNLVKVSPTVPDCFELFKTIGSGRGWRAVIERTLGSRIRSLEGR